MTDINLNGRRILVVEDEYFLAEDLREELADCGAQVLGPVANIKDATSFIKTGGVDAAVLDINLQGELIFSTADELRERGIPFAFATGYDRSSVSPRFADVPRLEKPLKARQLAELLQPLVAG
jgi:DNA-binding response OmpR family regulator